MKRVVVFAHYDKQNLIDDYVVYYLKALKEVASEIIFVSCCDVKNPKVLSGIATHIIAEPHNEYDFGSYKRGFLYIKERLNEFDEIIFANDSCFGPFHPLKEIFEEMSNKDCDFWGITKNNYGYNKKISHFFKKRLHIQSYFIVLKKTIFTTKLFEQFMSQITHEKNKKLVISKYEIGLSELLFNNGFKHAVYIDAFNNINNITILKWRQIILDYKMPFIKCSLPRLVNKNITTVEGWQDIVKKVSNYPIELIENNIKRVPYSKKSAYTSPIWSKRMLYDFLADCPFVIRKTISTFISICLPFLRD